MWTWVPCSAGRSGRRRREHVADALGKGAELLSGGREPEGEAYEKGYFFLPTVLGEADHSMRVMREETFGPVAPIMKFKTLEEAIASCQRHRIWPGRLRLYQ